jgi:hypothetical protein
MGAVDGHVHSMELHFAVMSQSRLILYLPTLGEFWGKKIGRHSLGCRVCPRVRPPNYPMKLSVC